MDRTDFGKKVKTLRLQKGLSLRKFAEKIKRSPCFACWLEKGTASPGEETLEKLSEVLGEEYRDDLYLMAGKLPDEIWKFLRQGGIKKVREMI